MTDTADLERRLRERLNIYHCYEDGVAMNTASSPEITIMREAATALAAQRERIRVLEEALRKELAAKGSKA